MLTIAANGKPVEISGEVKTVYCLKTTDASPEHFSTMVQV
jgi:hypothetical protein